MARNRPTTPQPPPIVPPRPEPPPTVPPPPGDPLPPPLPPPDPGPEPGRPTNPPSRLPDPYQTRRLPPPDNWWDVPEPPPWEEVPPPWEWPRPEGWPPPPHPIPARGPIGQGALTPFASLYSLLDTGYGYGRKMTRNRVPPIVTEVPGGVISTPPPPPPPAFAAPRTYADALKGLGVGRPRQRIGGVSYVEF